MPRASRYLIEGYTYHLTQRCTNRQSLLRFERDRRAYREWLRTGVQRHGISLFGYCLMDTHVHLLVRVNDVTAVGEFMDLVAGATAQQYNRRKERSGAFWEPYQCTIVEDGQHLWNCLRYIDLNMVRAGGVSHPRAWKWCSYAELMGERQRYRVLDMPALLEALNVPGRDDFRARHAEAVSDAIENGYLQREPQWTESLAVGSEDFVADVVTGFPSRKLLEYTQTTSRLSGPAWTVREAVARYATI